MADSSSGFASRISSVSENPHVGKPESPEKKVVIKPRVVQQESCEQDKITGQMETIRQMCRSMELPSPMAASIRIEIREVGSPEPGGGAPFSRLPVSSPQALNCAARRHGRGRPEARVPCPQSALPPAVRAPDRNCPIVLRSHQRRLTAGRTRSAPLCS